MAYEQSNATPAADPASVLHHFRNECGQGFGTLVPDLQQSGARCDYTTTDVSRVFEAMFRRIKTVPKEPDVAVPEWIRSTETYKGGLFSFDLASQILVLRFAYYLGETFVRSFRVLRWNVGAVGFAQEGMPVVSGFSFNKEMPPILIATNAFRRAIKSGSTERMASTVDTWITNVPSKP